MQVGVIGVGAMGIAMAGHMQKAGHAVCVNDISPERMDDARAAGLATVSLADMVRQAEFFLIVVVSDEQSRSVTHALLDAGAPSGSIIAVAATNHPKTMVELATDCAARGVGFIDAPVVFGLKGAQDGDLGSLCGGSEADVERARPAMAAYSRFVRRMGGVGAGQLAKTCNNMMHWAACVANYEVLLLAKRYGIDAQMMRETLLECPARNTTLERWDSTNFTWHEKDLDVALDLAQTGGVPTPLFGQIDQLIKLLGRDAVRALLYGPEAYYLGRSITPLTQEEGALR
jgi:3-hydroxyisobutyrate dehydrogenase